MKPNKYIIVPFICENVNVKGEFLNDLDLKHLDIVPMHKNKSKTSKTNCRPVSILSNFSKLYVKLITLSTF